MIHLKHGLRVQTVKHKRTTMRKQYRRGMCTRIIWNRMRRQRWSQQMCNHPGALFCNQNSKITLCNHIDTHIVPVARIWDGFYQEYDVNNSSSVPELMMLRCCGRIFTNRGSLNRHRQDRHEPRAKCPRCTFTAAGGRKSLIRHHMERLHPELLGLEVKKQEDLKKDARRSAMKLKKKNRRDVSSLKN